MSTIAIARTIPSTEVDNRAAYASFAFAYVFGHGASALTKGTDPLMTLPGWLPIGLLAAGLIAGTVLSMAASLKAQRHASEERRRAEKLVGASWITGFAALAIAITGLSSAFDKPELQTVLWPAGATIVVGLIYLAEGSVRRNALHYNLGTWLALVAAASLFLPAPGIFAAIAVLGGGGYVTAAILERRRLAALAA